MATPLRPRTRLASSPGRHSLRLWRAKEHRELPEALRSSFNTTDDCKPVEDCSKVLISAACAMCSAFIS